MAPAVSNLEPMPGISVPTASEDEAPLKYPRHPLSACFPELDAEESQKLTDDVREHGLRHKIVLYEGQVLDGWNRQLACSRAGVEAGSLDFVGDATAAAAFVISANVHRRSLTASQRGAVVVAVHKWSSTGRPGKVVINTTFPEKTIVDMAKEAGISPSQVSKNRYVQRNGSEEQKAAVLNGMVTASAMTEKIRGKPRAVIPRSKVTVHRANESQERAWKALEGKNAELLIENANIKSDLKAARESIKTMDLIRDADDPLGKALEEIQSEKRVIGLWERRWEIREMNHKKEMEAARSDIEKLRCDLAQMTAERDKALRAQPTPGEQK